MKGLIDSTLREGGQMVGVNFRLEEKLMIIRGLDRIGIEEIEVGLATALDRDLPELMRRARSAGIRARLALWSRCRPEDIDQAGCLKPDVLSLSIPGSDLHIEKKLGRDRHWVLARVFPIYQFSTAPSRSQPTGIKRNLPGVTHFFSSAALRLFAI